MTLKEALDDLAFARSRMEDLRLFWGWARKQPNIPADVAYALNRNWNWVSERFAAAGEAVAKIHSGADVPGPTDQAPAGHCPG